MRIGRKRTRRTVLRTFAILVCALVLIYVVRLNVKTLADHASGAATHASERSGPDEYKATPNANSLSGVADTERPERRDVLTDRAMRHGVEPASPPAAGLGIPAQSLFVTREWAEEKLKSIGLDQENRFNRFYTLLGVPRIPDRILSDDAVIIDIGANIGKFSDRARLMCAECTIVCFEAVPLYAARIKRRQTSEKTKVIARGLSNRSGVADIFMDLNNIGWNTLVQGKVEAGMSKVTIEVLRLDDIDFTGVIDPSKVSLIKIDTEGSEGHILNGAHEFLSKLHPKPIIFLEVAWGTKDNPNWVLIRNELEWLFANGWKRLNYDGLTKTEDLKIYPND